MASRQTPAGPVPVTVTLRDGGGSDSRPRSATPSDPALQPRPPMRSLFLFVLLTVTGCATSAPAPAPGPVDRPGRAVALVEAFWAEVWNPPYDLDAVANFVTDDVVLTTSGEDVVGPEAFREWIARFQTAAPDLRLEAHDTFASADGTRVTSRWTARARNGGLFGTEPDGRAVSFTGVAVWEVRWADGPAGPAPRLAHNWVERSAYELYRRLTAEPSVDR